MEPTSSARFTTTRLAFFSLAGFRRSEEHTSELQSQSNLVCRLLLEKTHKKTNSSNSQLQSRRELMRAVIQEDSYTNQLSRSIKHFADSHQTIVPNVQTSF